MNERLNRIIGPAVARWNQFSSNQRRNIVVAAIAVLACLGVILWMLLRPNYVTVMSGLDDKSLGQVESKLQDLKIPDKIVGSSVEVPSSQADTARVQLATAGLPQTGYIGYSSIQNSFGMTDSEFNIQVLDALQQSLNQTIESIDGVESAQVHVVMPDQQLFVSQPDSQAKASVFVQLGSGVRLSSAQVSGIQQLVAHAVKGLAATDVTVVDQNGVTLSDQTQASPSAGGQDSASSELDIRRNYEQQLTSQLTSGLNQILGPGNAVVMVHANLTFDQVQTHSETYQPVQGSTTGLPSSTQTQRSSSSSTQGTAPGGVAGQGSTNPSLPSYSSSGSNGGNSTTSSSQTTTNYDNSKTVKDTTSDPVQLNGFTVGVFVNSQDKAVNASVVNQIKSFVASAVGMAAPSGQVATNGANNNSINVEAVPFNQAQSSVFSKQNSNALMWGLIGAAVLVLLIVFLTMRSRKRKAESMEEVDIDLPPLDTLERLPASEDERMKEELAKLANNKPSEFASLLRTWLAGD